MPLHLCGSTLEATAPHRAGRTPERFTPGGAPPRKVKPVDLSALQQAIRSANVDGWLFYDFHNRELLAYRILGLDASRKTSRRWFYWVPAEGEPVRLVHGVEPTRIDALSGRKHVYSTWQQLREALALILADAATVAMQYSPECDIPYISMVDAGTIELVRTYGGVEVVSSADLVSLFEATFDQEGVAGHRRAMALIHTIKDEAFARIREALRAGTDLSEFDIARYILDRFEQEQIDPDNSVPIVGIDAHPADPHFEPTPENTIVFGPDQCVLIDLWAREKTPLAIFADVTWCGYTGDAPDPEYLTIWKAVTDARDAACAFALDRLNAGTRVEGWEIDDVCRDVIRRAGYGDWFIHRTGHSIGHEVHGNGANIANFETRDRRAILPGTAFSIEPGIYLEGRMAARTEVDILVTPDGKAEISGPVQGELIAIG